MKPRMDIYIAGVGGQGIGLVSEVLTRALRLADIPTIGCDTHGIAQRGGSVASHLRIGGPLFGPLIPAGGADLVIALERLEAERAIVGMLKPGGHVFCCDLQIQPALVRTRKAPYPPLDSLRQTAATLGGRLTMVPVDTLPDPRMGNTALLARLTASGVIEGLTAPRVLKALGHILPPSAFEGNRVVFESSTRCPDP